MFLLMDYVEDDLSEQELKQLKFYNKLSFSVYDKYQMIRSVRKEIDE